MDEKHQSFSLKVLDVNLLKLTGRWFHTQMVTNGTLQTWCARHSHIESPLYTCAHTPITTHSLIPTDWLFVCNVFWAVERFVSSILSVITQTCPISNVSQTSSYCISFGWQKRKNRWLCNAVKAILLAYLGSTHSVGHCKSTQSSSYWSLSNEEAFLSWCVWSLPRYPCPHPQSTLKYLMSMKIFMKIKCYDLYTQTSHFNPAEHLHSFLDQCVRQHSPSKQQLREYLRKEQCPSLAYSSGDV